MSLNLKNFKLLIETIIKRFGKNIILTSGKININQFEQIKNNYFKKINNNIFKCEMFSKKIIFYDNTDFRDLENIVKYSDEVICCEGAISHVSNAFNKKTYALINNFKTAKFWTNHMKNIKLLKRDNIIKVCSQISLI